MVEESVEYNVIAAHFFHGEVIVLRSKWDEGFVRKEDFHSWMEQARNVNIKIYTAGTVSQLKTPFLSP